MREPKLYVTELFGLKYRTSGSQMKTDEILNYETKRLPLLLLRASTSARINLWFDLCAKH